MRVELIEHQVAQLMLEYGEQSRVLPGHLYNPAIAEVLVRVHNGFNGVVYCRGTRVLSLIWHGYRRRLVALNGARSKFDSKWSTSRRQAEHSRRDENNWKDREAMSILPIHYLSRSSSGPRASVA